MSWPRLIHQEDAPLEKFSLYADIDEVFVLRIEAETESPSDDSVQAQGLKVVFPQIAVEHWLYLPDDAARRLHEALTEWLADAERRS